LLYGLLYTSAINLGLHGLLVGLCIQDYKSVCSVYDLFRPG